MKIRKGDKVKVISGKDKGVESTVKKVYPKRGLIVVENVNKVARHMKPSGQNRGGIVKVEKPIDASNVMMVCLKCSKATRVGYKLVDNKKYRVCKKCGEVIA